MKGNPFFCEIISNRKGSACAAGFDTVLSIVKFYDGVFVEDECINQQSQTYHCHKDRNFRFLSLETVLLIKKVITQKNTQDTDSEGNQDILRGVAAEIHSGKTYKNNKQGAQKFLIFFCT